MWAPADARFEVAPRVERVEQQLDALPPAWKAFAGPPMAMHYFGTRINTFRANPALQRPPGAYCDWAAGALRLQLGAYVQHLRPGGHLDVLTAILEGARDAEGLTDAELRDIVSQEWRSDLARNVMQIRVNRHGSACGPVVQRSARGVLSVVAPPAPAPPSPPPASSTTSRGSSRSAFVLDAIAMPPRERRPRERGRQ